MAFKINGFGGMHSEKTVPSPVEVPVRKAVVPKKSMVQVRFAGRGMALSYYNDQFDLKVGDLVYVDGKLEGKLGQVTDVNYNFKIKISEYKKVIALVDTDVSGQFFMAGSHAVTFDPAALPKEQVTMWFKAPVKEDDEFVSGSDDSSFCLDHLRDLKINDTIAERGHNYYLENRVRYLCLDVFHGYAVVEGEESYVVEFEYRGGEISRLTCDCPCSYTCKHEFAAMLQLRETLGIIDKQYAEQFDRTGYFAAINKGTLFAFAIEGKETGSFTI